MYHALLLSEGGGIISQNSVSKQTGSACVMIGIGGTGLAALRRVKKEVYQHLEPDDPQAAVPTYSKIAFLGLDTDTGDLTVQNPDVTELQADEQFVMGVPALGAMLAAPDIRTDPCLKWLSGRITLQMGNRQVGRFCLFKNAEALRTKLSEAVAQVMAAAGTSSVQVHVFAGISGGTGSGCFLDVCYILRDVLKDINSSTVCGYFFLPDTQLYRPGIRGDTPVENYNKRNGYAALRDLDYCMSIPSSGGRFQENYTHDFRIESVQAPVDICYLISAKDQNGFVRPNGFPDCLDVVTAHVWKSIAELPGPHLIWPFEGHYASLGISNAELPLTHIGTYLAAATYAKMKPSLGRHSSQLACDHFANRIGCTTNGLISELASGVNTAIAFNPNLEKLPKLNEGMQDWSLVPEWLHGPIEACRITAIGRIQFNYTAQSKDLDGYDAKKSGQVEHPTFILRLFNELVKVCVNPEEGPTMAAELLHGNGIHDLRAVLKGISADIDAKESNFRANEQVRIQGIMNAAHKYNKAITGWKKKLEEYQDAWTEYVKLQINLELCAKLKNLIPTLERLLDTMYRNYFAPLQGMITELGDTFDANLSWLNNPKHATNESFCWRIFEYDAVKGELDATVLKPQDAAIEHQNFVDYLLNHFREWSTRSKYRTAHCVNTYMAERFQAVLKKQVSYFLQQPIWVHAELLEHVSQRATSLFWESPMIQMNHTTTVSNQILFVPMGSPAINSAATAFAQATPNVIVRHSARSDHVSCLRVVSGISLNAYQEMEGLREAVQESGKGPICFFASKV